MGQDSVIAGAFFLAFLLYIGVRGQIPQFVALLTGSGQAPAGASTSPGAAPAGVPSSPYMVNNNPLVPGYSGNALDLWPNTSDPIGGM